MRRDSFKALALVELARADGLDILGSRLEAWSTEGLLWPEEGISDERKLEYLRWLVRLTGHRKSRDRAARIMAVHGCPCARLRSAIGPGPADGTWSSLDGLDNEDRGDRVDEIADEWMDSPPGTDTLYQQTADVLGSAVMDRAKTASRELGPSEASERDAEILRERGITVKDEPADAVRRSFGSQIAQGFDTGDFSDPDVVSTFTGMTGEETDIFAEMLPGLPEELNNLTSTMALDELATLCRVSRTTMAPDQLPPQFSRLADEDLDEIAAMKAPTEYLLQLHLLQNVAGDQAEAALREAYGLPISDEDRAALPPLDEPHTEGRAGK